MIKSGGTYAPTVFSVIQWSFNQYDDDDDVLHLKPHSVLIYLSPVVNLCMVSIT